MGMGLAGDGGRRSVVQDSPNVGDADVGRTPGVRCRDDPQFDPAADGILAYIVANAGKVAVYLTDGACFKCLHNFYLLKI